VVVSWEWADEKSVGAPVWEWADEKSVGAPAWEWADEKSVGARESVGVKQLAVRAAADVWAWAAAKGSADAKPVAAAEWRAGHRATAKPDIASSWSYRGVNFAMGQLYDVPIAIIGNTLGSHRRR
jgi:hypothetical protein